MATAKGHRIGEMLLDEEIITQEQLQECLREQKTTGEKVGQVLVRKGYVSLEVLMAFLGTQMNVPYLPLAGVSKPAAALMKLLPEQLMRSQQVIPVDKKGNTIMLAMADPTNVFVTDDIKLATRCDLELRLSSESEIKAALDENFGFQEEDTGELVKSSGIDEDFGAAPDLSMPAKPMVGAGMARPAAARPAAARPAAARPTAARPTAAAPKAVVPEPEPITPPLTAQVMGGDTPVINFLTNILVEANKAGATDIHFEPYEKSFRIRWRIDGVLREVQSPPRSLANALATKLRTMAEMDTQGKGIAQYGRLKLKIPGKDVSISILILPTMWGEKIVMHMLNLENVILNIEKLGMEPSQLELYRRVLQQPYGLVLITGPKASGKTTTAYATLNSINLPTKNVSSVDELVDYSLPGINQVVVNEKRGMTYANGVRAMLEQDSDIMLVGEMQDAETSRMILDAVPTGHLIISTLHASNPVTALQYLMNMDIEPYLLSSALTAIVNQKLVRVICPKCKEIHEASAEITKFLGIGGSKKTVLYRGRGCTQCSQTGFRGRQAVFEIILLTESVREAIINRQSAAVVKKAIENIPGYTSLRRLVAQRVINGVTSYEEFLRVAG